MTAVAVQTASAFGRRIALVSLLPWMAVLALHGADVDIQIGPWVAVRVLLAGHVGATVAFYADKEMAPILRSNRARYFVAPLAAMMAAVVLFRWHGASLAGVVVVLAVWQIHHTTKQNLGVFSFWLRARGAVRLSADERRLLQLTTVLGVLGVAKYYGELPGHLDALGMLCLAPILVLWWRCRSDDMARNGALLLAVAFYLPLYLISDPGVAVLSFGAAHGFQYLMMMSEVTVGRPPSRATAVIACAAVGLLSVNSAGSSLMTGLITGAVVAHYVIDAGAWRLSEAPQREYMRRRFAFL